MWLWQPSYAFTVWFEFKCVVEVWSLLDSFTGVCTFGIYKMRTGLLWLSQLFNLAKDLRNILMFNHKFGCVYWGNMRRLYLRRLIFHYTKTMVIHIIKLNTAYKHVAFVGHRLVQFSRCNPRPPTFYSIWMTRVSWLWSWIWTATPVSSCREGWDRNAVLGVGGSAWN